jgi:hypothetical protein
VLIEQVGTRGGLRREHADRFSIANADRDTDEWQIGVVNAESIEKTRFIGDARQYPGLIARQDTANHALTGAVAYGLERGRVVTVQGAHEQISRLLIDQADHPVTQIAHFMHQVQDLAQGLTKIERFI